MKRFIGRESHLLTRANPETLALAREAKAAGSKMAVLSNITSGESCATSSIGSMSSTSRPGLARTAAPSWMK
jgi:hypothetical protein